MTAAALVRRAARSILRISDEGDFSLAGLLDAVEAGYLLVGISILQVRAQGRRNS